MMRIRVGAIVCFLVVCITGGSGWRAQTNGPDFSKVRGVNFIPFYARNSEEIWEKYDHDSINRDLQFAAGLGFNSVRVFLHYEAFRQNPSRFVDSFVDFLKLCAHYKLSVLPVLFDSCGLDPPADSTVITSGEAYAKFLADPSLPASTKARLNQTYSQYALGRGAGVLVPVGRTTPIDVLLWGWWTPSPGIEGLTRDHWPQLDTYLDKVLGTFQQDPSIIAWDIMNEPGTLSQLPSGVTRDEAERRIADFLDHECRYVKACYPAKPLTLGAENLKRTEATQQYVDILSLHVYKPYAETERTIADANALAMRAGKPLIITECLANTNNWLTVFGEESLASDGGQLAHYQRFLPLLMQSHLGWYSWGFLTGHLFGGFVDIIDPNGYRRPAAVYLHQLLMSPAGTR